MSQLTFSAPVIFLVAIASCSCAGTQSRSDDDALYTDARAPGITPPSSPDEDAILKKIEHLKPGQSATLGGTVVAVLSSYQAASGRECRNVTLSDSAGVQTSRLVCRMNDTWGYAPDVYPEPSSTAKQ